MGRAPATGHRGTERAVWGVAVLAVATTVTTFGPWGRSGSRMRDSYELVDVAGRAGVLPDDLEALAFLWFLVPALCGVALVTAALERQVTMCALATTLGALVGIGAVLVVRSPLAPGFGALSGIALGGCTVAGGVALLLKEARGR